MLAFTTVSLSGCVLFYFPPSLQRDDEPKVQDAVSAAPGEAIFYNIFYQEDGRSISVHSVEDDYAAAWQSMGSAAQFLTVQDIDLKYSDGSIGKRRVIRLKANTENPGIAGANPTFTGVRQTASKASYTTRIIYMPQKAGDRAGVLAWQDHRHYVFCGVSLIDGKPAAVLSTRAASDDTPNGSVQATRLLSATSFRDLGFRLDIQDSVVSCFFIDKKSGMTLVGQSQDILGRNGTLIGAHAYSASTVRQ